MVGRLAAKRTNSNRYKFFGGKLFGFKTDQVTKTKLLYIYDHFLKCAPSGQTSTYYTFGINEE